jgi:hypothetical protein
MPFPEWLDAVYRQPGESRSTAVMRLAGETGITYKTLFYAAKGARTAPRIALQLAEFSGGRIDAGALALAPKREDIKNAEPEDDAA